LIDGYSEFQACKKIQVRMYTANWTDSTATTGTDYISTYDTSSSTDYM